MTLLDQDPEPSAASDGPEMSYSQLSPSHAVVPPPINDIDPASRHHLQPKQNAAARLKSSSSHPSLLLLSTSTTDPSLFSFDLIKRLNKQHLASIPPNPFSAISVAQQQQQKQKRQRLESEPVRNFHLFHVIQLSNYFTHPCYRIPLSLLQHHLPFFPLTTVPSLTTTHLLAYLSLNSEEHLLLILPLLLVTNRQLLR